MSQRKSVSRREFMKGAAFAAAAISAGLGAERNASGQGQPLVLGVIGTGAQGRALLSELVKMKDVDVAALCDVYRPHLEKAEKIAGGNVWTYDDYHKMLESHGEMQAVIIATPPALHAQMCLDALKTGKNVFCESALGLTVEDCKKAAKAAAESKAVFQVGHQRRYSPIYRHALKFIKSGVIGRITAIRAQWQRKQSWRRGVADPKADKLLNWRLYKESSGGLMAEFGSHQVDVANWFLKAVPTAVVGTGGIDNWKDGREVNDNVEVIFEYPGGVRLIYSASLNSSYQGEYEVIMGTESTILLPQDGTPLLFKEADAVALGWEQFAKKEMRGNQRGIVLDANATKYERQEGKQPVKPADTKTDFRHELEGFVRSIREGKKVECDAEAGLKAAVACIKANEAIEEKTRVELTEEMFKVS